MTPVILTSPITQNSADINAITDRLNALGNTRVVLTSGGNVIGNSPLELIGDSCVVTVPIDGSKIDKPAGADYTAIPAAATVTLDLSVMPDMVYLALSTHVTLAFKGHAPGIRKTILATGTNVNVNTPAAVKRKNFGLTYVPGSLIGKMEITCTGTTDASTYAQTWF